MRFLSLFSGIGGLDLGLERAGWECVAQCEREPFCREVLARHWPGVPCFDDVTHLGAREGWVDAVVGGFPCQDISAAGKGAGIEGERSGLWKQMHRIIREAGPDWVVAENVPALRTRGADVVLGDLEGLGYTCWPLVVGAVHAGAPHRRQRVFIVANSGGVSGREAETGRADGTGRAAAAGSGKILAHASVQGHEGELRGIGHGPQGRQDEGRPAAGRGGSPFPPALNDYARWRGVLEADLGLAPALPIELQICGVADGLPERVVRRWRKEALKAYGNSVVPQVAQAIGEAINEVEAARANQQRKDGR